MNQNDLEINLRLMEEMGLEEGDRKRVYDQDTGVMYQLKGKDIVAPGNKSGKNAIELDMINKPKLMTYMFGHFVDKLVEEEDIPPVSNFYIDPYDRYGHTTGVIRFEDDTIIRSEKYRNETTCLADLVLRLNNDTDIDLSKYDIDRRKSKNKPSKKKEEPELRSVLSGAIVPEVDLDEFESGIRSLLEGKKMK